MARARGERGLVAGERVVRVEAAQVRVLRVGIGLAREKMPRSGSARSILRGVVGAGAQGVPQEARVAGVRVGVRNVAQRS